MENREIEAKFLGINKTDLVKKLSKLEAIDLGEELLAEIIFYDKELLWQKSKDKMVRIRTTGKGNFLTYKNSLENTLSGMEEIEFQISDIDMATQFLERIGLVKYRHQEKRRHKFLIGSVIIDIDTWPQVPTYVEIEGPSEDEVKQTAVMLGFDFSKAVFGNSGIMVEELYKIPVRFLRYFTFDKVE